MKNSSNLALQDSAQPPTLNLNTTTALSGGNIPDVVDGNQFEEASGKIKKCFYSIQEVMTVTALGSTSIYKAIREGKLVAKKFGKKTLITAESLESFIGSLPTVGGSND